MPGCTTTIEAELACRVSRLLLPSNVRRLLTDTAKLLPTTLTAVVILDHVRTLPMLTQIGSILQERSHRLLQKRDPRSALRELRHLRSLLILPKRTRMATTLAQHGPMS